MKRRAAAQLTLVLAMASCGGAHGDSQTTSGGSQVDALLNVETDPFKKAESVGAEMRQEQAYVVRCMSKLGFVYVAWIPPDIAVLDPAESLSRGEYAAKYGLGITTRGEIIRQQREVALDPNLALQQSLGETELRAYRLALSGTSESGGVLSAQETGGCLAEAAEWFRPRSASASDADLSLYFERRNALNDSLVAHPAVQTAIATWRKCMVNLGYAAEHPNSLGDLVTREWARLAPGADASIADPVTASALSRDELAQHIDPAKFDSLVQFELALAVADQSCEGGIDAAITVARNELEPPWIEENQALLSRVRGSIR